MSRFAPLQQLAELAAATDWAALCAQPERAAAYSYEAAGLRLDLGREHLNESSMAALRALAVEVDWEEARRAQWRGDVVNPSEGRAVLHGALRSPQRAPAHIQAEVEAAEAALHKLLATLEQDCPEHAVLHIGIGGSDLGPRLAADVAGRSALRRPLHFLNNLDDATLQETLGQLDPARTLVVVVSKSFGTAETRALQQRCTDWLHKAGVDPAQALIAVTSKAEAALACGLDPERILPLPEWVGGRTSVWSTVSFSLALACGAAAREALREGAAAMDAHFLDTPLERNLPALAALCGIWQRNAQGLSTRIVVPYADRLRLLPEYLQQLEMESNGKRVDLQGRPLDWDTAPVTFGGVGSCVQHAFFQLLHQSNSRHPVEFVLPARTVGVPPDLQRTLSSHALAQACALTQGRAAVGEDQSRLCPGGRPSTLIGMRQLDLYHLGSLLAFYEHRTAMQGWIWGLNSYDQFGVEIGKQIAGRVEAAWKGEGEFPDALSAAAANWLKA
ncbi:MAG: glucose-6-phosphate isomerase [Oceanococcaceae bacterium]